MVGPGIRFNDCMFSEPAPLNHWTAPRFAGLFVILASDGNWAPRPFQPLCFGEFGNNVRGPLGIGYVRLPAHSGPLFISILPMPFSSSAQRCEVRNHLTWAYNPVCQGSAAPSPNELARKLEELEKRHEEQTIQFRLLLANMNRFFEPLPERPRRQIGFLPQPPDPEPLPAN